MSLGSRFQSPCLPSLLKKQQQTQQNVRSTCSHGSNTKGGQVSLGSRFQSQTSADRCRLAIHLCTKKQQTQQNVISKRFTRVQLRKEDKCHWVRGSKVREQLTSASTCPLAIHLCTKTTSATKNEIKKFTRVQTRNETIAIGFEVPKSESS